MNVNRSKTGEVVIIELLKFDDLDSGSPMEKTVVGLSKYGIDINQKDYKLFIKSDDSLFLNDTFTVGQLH